MGTGYMVINMNPNQTIFDAETFIEEAQQKWPGCQTYKETRRGMNSDAGANIDPIDAPSFMVHHFSGNHMIDIDGNPFNSAEVAAWIRATNPDSSLELWFTDEYFSGHTILFPGITAQEVLDNWVDHDEHDPYVEYPQYFH